MKNINKILLLIVLVATTLLLSSCGKKPDITPEFAFYDVNHENLVVEELNDSVKLASAEFYHVEGSGKVVLHEDLDEASEILFLFANDDNKYTLDQISEDDTKSIEDAYAKIYLFDMSIPYTIKKKSDIKTFDFEIVQYQKDAAVDSSYVYVDYVSYDENNKLNRNGAVLTDSYLFDGELAEFYEISPNGANELDHTKMTFTEKSYNEELPIIDGKKYVNNTTFTLVASIEGVEDFEFDVRLAAQYAPISGKTANFWDWVLLRMPVAYFMAFIGKLFNNSFAIAILVTTILVRTLAWPIYAQTNDMSMKMSIAQPELDRLNQKYATRKDPESQQKMQMEMMAIYKKHNINFFGCLMPFLQMPIFFAMYQVVRRITVPGGQFSQDVSNTKFFFTDLEHSAMIAKIVFTALVGITMFVLQKISQKKPSYAKQTPKKKQDPNQPNTEQTMKMVSFMMIFMMVMTAFATPGLSLSYYWIIGNVFSIGQTYINRHLNEKKFAKLQEEKLYGKSREIIDAQFKKKGDK